MTAANTRTGKETEQMVARWLRGNGYPQAKRIVRTGWASTSGTSPDEGDVDCGAPITVQCKSLRPVDRMERAVPGWLAETEQQRQASGAHLGILVVRRWGTTDVGRWWCFLDTVDLVQATGGIVAYLPADVVMPVRLELRHAVALLAAWGYGEGLAEDGAA